MNISENRKKYKASTSKSTHMHGGGPSPSGSNFLHSYGLAEVSNAQTSAKGRFPNEIAQILYDKKLIENRLEKPIEKLNPHLW